MKNIKNFNEYINEGYELSKKYDLSKRKYNKIEDTDDKDVEIKEWFKSKLSNVIVKEFGYSKYLPEWLSTKNKIFYEKDDVIYFVYNTVTKELLYNLTFNYALDLKFNIKDYKTYSNIIKKYVSKILEIDIKECKVDQDICNMTSKIYDRDFNVKFNIISIIK